MKFTKQRIGALADLKSGPALYVPTLIDKYAASYCYCDSRGLGRPYVMDGPWILKKLDPEGLAVLRKIINSLSSNYYRYPWHNSYDNPRISFDIIINIGKSACLSIDDLRKLGSSHPNPYVSLCSEAAISIIDPRVPPPIASLKEAMDNGNLDQRDAALEALFFLTIYSSHPLDELVPHVVKLLDVDDVRMRIKSRNGLGIVAKKSSAVAEALRHARIETGPKEVLDALQTRWPKDP